MGCDSWLAKLDRYLDGELPAEEMRSFDAHVRGCPSCAVEALSRVQIKRGVQAAGKRFAPSVEFRERIRKSVAARPQWSVGVAWRAATWALALTVLAGVTYWASLRSRTDQVFGEVADLHVANLASSSPVEVVSSDRHTVKPWFQGKIPFAFDLPGLERSEFSLVGGRVSYLEQAPGAHLIYRIRKHEISVFIFQEQSLRGRLGENPSVARRMSFNAATWSQGGLRYLVVGDASANDIESLIGLLRTAQSSGASSHLPQAPT